MADDTPPWHHDLSDEQRNRVEEHISSRFRGAAKRQTELESQLGAVEQGQLALARGALQAEELTAAIGAHVEALTAGVPAEVRSLIPTSLPAAELLRWLGENLAKLQPAARIRDVDGAGGRRVTGPGPSKADQARIAALRRLGLK